MDDPRAAGVLQSYVGQARIVRHERNARELSVRRGAPPSGTCETAVVVRSSALARGTARLSLEALGRPKARGGERCPDVPSDLALAVAGFGPADTPEQVQAALDAVLQTPEEYLRARGVTFAPFLADEVGPPYPLRPPRITTQPKGLLAVDAYYHDPAGRVRYEGELEFEATVGRDGRLQDPRMKTSLAAPQQKVVLLALSLWRYEPALEGPHPVSAPLESRLVLRIR